MGSLLASGLLDVWPTVLGVVLALCGGAVTLMSLIGVAERAGRRAWLGALAGLALLLAGLWLVGYLG